MPCDLGFEVWGLGFRVWGSIKIKNLGLRASFAIQTLNTKHQTLGLTWRHMTASAATPPLVKQPPNPKP
jgi:hypothetical protein